MCLPEDIPDNLVAIRDAAIEFTHGRIKELPEPMDELENWLEEEGYDACDIIDNVISFGEISDAFNDEMLSTEEDIEINKITNSNRLQFARKLIKNSETLFVQKLILSNEKDSVLVGFIKQEMGMHDLGISCYGLFKTEEDFIDDLKHSDWYKFSSDAEELNDENILNLWKNK